MTKRKISISTCFDYKIPIEQQIPLIANAGFSHLSIGEKEQHSKYRDNASRHRIKELLSEYGLGIDTLHGPSLDKPDVIHEMSDICIAANDLSIPVIVLHGSSFSFHDQELDDRLEALMRVCGQLENVSKEYGVKFALENVMPGPATELIRRTVSAFNSKYIGFCYDSAHDQIGGPKPFDLINELYGRLIAVHLSDRIREFVDHVIPWDGFINWQELSTILRKSDFTAPLLLEVMVLNSEIKEPVEFLGSAYQRGCKLYDLICYN